MGMGWESHVIKAEMLLQCGLKTTSTTKNSIGISFSPLICPDKCPGLGSFMDIKIGKGKKENQLISKC